MRALIKIRVTNLADHADVAAAIKDAGATAVISTVGTSRMNSEVIASMDKDGGDSGFEQWLQAVDVECSAKLAIAAAAAGHVRFFGRISANGANSQQEGGGFNLYFKYQGIADAAVLSALRERVESGTMRVGLLKPGRLDRGDALRSKRQHEVAQHTTAGPGLSVIHLAAVMIEEAGNPAPLVVILKNDEIAERTSGTAERATAGLLRSEL
jgi:hypothetical protein